MHSSATSSSDAKSCLSKTGVRDTHAVLVRYEKDPVGVHTAELAHVDRDSGCGTIASNRRCRKRVVVDLVSPGDHVQIFRVNGSVGLYGA